ncbi:hypothetical protein C8R45DRAFT_1117318 [Mycena sanguinolenta]|nr:hypothetical protein C8R45DRAFT_1117318 [Mycena sanguinolenta]
MATATTSAADRLRIAIALTALKFKPPDQSCAAYVLQLRAAFQPSTPTAPTADGSWKTHALALEKELASLKLKYEAEQINTLVTPSASMSDAATSNSQSVKRKPKKKAIARPVIAPSHVDLETVLESLRGGAFRHLVPMYSLIDTRTRIRCPSYGNISILKSLRVRGAHFCITIIRSCCNGRSMFSSAIHHNSSSYWSRECSPSYFVLPTLQALTGLVNDLVSSSLPFLLRKPKLLNKLLDMLLTSILNPVVESFHPLSRRYLTFLFPIMPSTTLPVDVRSEVLHLFQSAFSPLISASSAYEVDLRATIALTALQELENLFPPPWLNNTRLPRTHTHRLKALVRKDALCYLCTVLHVVFSPPKDHSKSGLSSGAIAERKIVDSFSRITNRCHKFDAADTCNTSDRDTDVEVLSRSCPDYLDLDIIDEMGYQMILGAMERFWRWTGEFEPGTIV